jgi:hypothetical protein
MVAKTPVQATAQIPSVGTLIIEGDKYSIAGVYNPKGVPSSTGKSQMHINSSGWKSVTLSDGRDVQINIMVKSRV